MESGSGGGEGLKVLVVLDYSESFGGGFTYALNMCRLMSKMSIESFDLSFAATSDQDNKILIDNGIQKVIYDLVPYRSEGLICKVKRFIRKLNTRLIRKSLIDKVAKRYSFDLIYFVTPSSIALELNAAPFIFTVWDFCHRDWPDFPEVKDNGVFEGREKLYNYTLKKALNVIVDSEDLSEKAQKYYGVEKEKIVVIPFLMPDFKDINVSEDVVSKYDIKTPYIFYPAQFWEHKNHKYIIEAVSILKHKHNKVINVVFCGRDFGSLKSVQELAKERQVADLVKYLGFIPKEDVWGLYKNAIALVMPTYFGPTNIPPLEALAVECPVIYSDFPSFRKEFKGIAQFVDLEKPESLAEILLSGKINLSVETVDKLKAIHSENELSKRVKIFFERVKKCIVLECL